MEISKKTIESWSFPEVAFTDTLPTVVNMAETTPQQQTIDVNEVMRLKHECECLYQQLQQSIQLLQSILQKIKNPLAIIDDELSELLVVLVKKIAKKIILQEITVNPAMLANIITQLQQGFTEQEGPLTIQVSEQDYQRLQPILSSAQLQPHPTLSMGDVVIKTSIAELRAILEERIEQLVEINYD
jgi:flagellar biosynthesis/type III secretory pathway protein FliH